MTPKEKAKELVLKKFGCSKQYALLAVEEILKYQDSLVGMLDTNDGRDIMFWEQVKQEIEKL